MLPPRPSFNFQTRLLRTRSTETETTPQKPNPFQIHPGKMLHQHCTGTSRPFKISLCILGATYHFYYSNSLYPPFASKKPKNIHAQFFTTTNQQIPKASRNGIHQPSDESDGGLEIGICFVDGVIGQMHHDFWPWLSASCKRKSRPKSLDEIEATRSIKVTVETPEVLGVKKGQWLMMMVLMGMFDTYDFGISFSVSCVRKGYNTYGRALKKHLRLRWVLLTNCSWLVRPEDVTYQGLGQVTTSPSTSNWYQICTICFSFFSVL